MVRVQNNSKELPLCMTLDISGQDDTNSLKEEKTVTSEYNGRRPETVTSE